MTIRHLLAILVALSLGAPAQAAGADPGAASQACAGMADKRARKVGTGRPTIAAARCGAQVQEAP